MMLVLRRISWGLIQGIGKVMLRKKVGCSMTWVFSCCCCGGGMGCLLAGVVFLFYFSFLWVVADRVIKVAVRVLGVISGMVF